MKKFLTVMGKDFLKFLNTIGLPILLLLFMFCVTHTMGAAVGLGEYEWWAVLGTGVFMSLLTLYFPYCISKDMPFLRLPQPFKTLVVSVAMWTGMSLVFVLVAFIVMGGNTMFLFLATDAKWETFKLAEQIAGVCCSVFIMSIVSLAIGCYIYSIFERSKEET